MILRKHFKSKENNLKINLRMILQRENRNQKVKLCGIINPQIKIQINLSGEKFNFNHHK